MFSYRVTKYDPKLRDDSGRFLADDWTSISDIGKRYRGRVLTYDNYLAVENLYLQAIVWFAKDAHVNTLRIREAERFEDLPEGFRFPDDAIISLSQAKDLARLILREEAWCKLECSDKLRIHFGYDYYMYVIVSAASLSAIEKTRRAGLFVEPFASPYGGG